MHFLFINPLLPDIQVSLFSHDGKRAEVRTIPKGDDFGDFPEFVMKLIDQYAIEEIWCILGPGAFTRMRIVTLTLSTLTLTRGIRVKGCHFFDLIEYSARGIPILRANDREYITKISDEICLRDKESLPEGIYIGYGEKNDFTEGKNFIQYEEVPKDIFRFFQSRDVSDILTPIYLKEPHITWSKKKTFPSSEKMNI